MEKELILAKPESNSLKDKLKSRAWNLYNKIFWRTYRYMFDSLQDFYENADENIRVWDDLYLLNLTVLDSKGNDLEKIITLMDNSKQLDFKATRSWGKSKIEYKRYSGPHINPEYLVSMKEDEWKNLELLQRLDKINICFHYLDNIPYISYFERHEKGNRDKFEVPDYPEQLINIR